MNEDDGAGRGRGADHVAAVLLALAAVATAWATYQASHWRSEQALAGNRSTAARVEANRGVANRELLVDVETFTQWVDAYSTGETELANFYFRRFRAEFHPAVVAWVATKPLHRPAGACDSLRDARIHVSGARGGRPAGAQG